MKFFWRLFFLCFMVLTNYLSQPTLAMQQPQPITVNQHPEEKPEKEKLDKESSDPLSPPQLISEEHLRVDLLRAVKKQDINNVKEILEKYPDPRLWWYAAGGFDWREHAFLEALNRRYFGVAETILNFLCAQDDAKANKNLPPFIKPIDTKILRLLYLGLVEKEVVLIQSDICGKLPILCS